MNAVSSILTKTKHNLSTISKKWNRTIFYHNLVKIEEQYNKIT